MKEATLKAAKQKILEMYSDKEWFNGVGTREDYLFVTVSDPLHQHEVIRYVQVGAWAIPVKVYVSNPELYGTAAEVAELRALVIRILSCLRPDSPVRQ